MSTNDPLVSIIIPCYNYAHTLSETLNSIKAQTLSRWEAIIVNDGSSDNTREVIESFTLSDARFIGLHQENKGVSAARNAGIQAAKGTYVMFLDADDLITPRKLEAHKTHFDSDLNIDVSYSYCQYFHTSNPDKLYPSFDLTEKEWMQKLNGRGETIITPLMDKNLFVISSPVIRKSALPSNIAFKEDMAFYEDWLFWFSCAVAGLSFHYCTDEEGTTLIRVHSTSTVQNKEKMFDGTPLLIKEMRKVLDSAEGSRPPTIEKLKKMNSHQLEKWCRKKLKRSGTSWETLREITAATSKPTAYLATARHIIKQPAYFLKTFLRPK